MVHRTENALEWYVYIRELAWALMHPFNLDASEALRSARTKSLELYSRPKEIQKIYSSITSD